ncbi:hypothetical protein NBG4_10040 [Candidatus Sulfobium mesophilum]|uniref:Uncharacterized protein n=1 Tax=Candidatus Sulfobium mesophilum TaxID=2016548 RepID=A0A2U3QDL6_9BACT|nr:hypothetical protein NBG4_10040 [Candidatus Sulfobium mesophilum]
MAVAGLRRTDGPVTNFSGQGIHHPVTHTMRETQELDLPFKMVFEAHFRR